LKIKKMLGPKCEIVADFGKTRRTAPVPDLKKEIIGMIRRRPETAAGIARSLGAPRSEVKKALSALAKTKRIRTIRYRNRVYYEPV
jgi:hypothetical protein